MTEQEEAILVKLQGQITRMEVALLGYDGEQGQPGLCKQFDRLTRDYHRFKKFCCIIFGVLIGAGVLNVVTNGVWLA